MGCKNTKSDPISYGIDKEIEAARKRQKSNVKLLLLGAGESGKSTVAKQMKIIHLNGFTDEERKDFKSIIWNNVVGSIRVLVEAAQTLNISIAETETAKRVLREDYFMGELTKSIATDIQTVWSDPGIKKTFLRSNEFQLNDSAEYYFNEIERIGSDGYTPSVQDVLRSRAKTTGIIETEFTIQGTHFTLVDVGGQRSERRKWMHCFQDVTAVIFCAALSGYDLKLYEDETTNRMHEALKLFRDICNTKWFSETAIILFLNKRDIFEKKILKVPLTICFPDYPGHNNFEEASKYIADQFLAQNDNPNKLIYVHITCATDTENITVVFRAVQDIILNGILGRLGM